VLSVDHTFDGNSFKNGEKFERLLTEVGSFADPPQGSSRSSMAFTTSPFPSSARALLGGNNGPSAPATPVPPSASGRGSGSAPPTSLWPTPSASTIATHSSNSSIDGTGAGSAPVGTAGGGMAYVQMVELVHYSPFLFQVSYHTGADVAVGVD
jgi:hypothetical protein